MAQKLSNDLGRNLILHSLVIAVLFLGLLYANSLNSIVSYGAIVFFTFAIIDVIDFTAHRKSPKDTRTIVYMQLALTFFIMALAFSLGTTLTSLTIVVIVIIFLALLVEGIFIHNIERKLSKPEYPQQIQTLLNTGYAKVLLFLGSRAIYLVSFLILFGFMVFIPQAAATAYLVLAFSIDSLARSDTLDTKRMLVIMATSFLIVTALSNVLNGLALTPMLAITSFILALIAELLFHKIKVVNLAKMNLGARPRIG